MRSLKATDFPTILLMLRPHVYQFKITLHGISPPIWRRIQVPSDYSFFALHSAIQDVFGWQSRFSYRFENFSRKSQVTSIRSPLDVVSPSYERDCLVKHYFNREGDTATYVYHFALEWLMEITFEKIVPAVDGVSYPKCVGGEGGSPPETIGGPEVFQTHLDIVADPGNPSQNDTINILGLVGYSDQFNPESVVFKNPRERFDSLVEAQF